MATTFYAVLNPVPSFDFYLFFHWVWCKQESFHRPQLAAEPGAGIQSFTVKTTKSPKQGQTVLKLLPGTKLLTYSPPSHLSGCCHVVQPCPAEPWERPHPHTAVSELINQVMRFIWRFLSSESSVWDSHFQMNYSKTYWRNNANFFEIPELIYTRLALHGGSWTTWYFLDIFFMVPSVKQLFLSKMGIRKFFYSY